MIRIGMAGAALILAASAAGAQELDTTQLQQHADVVRQDILTQSTLRQKERRDARRGDAARTAKARAECAGKQAYIARYGAHSVRTRTFLRQCANLGL